MHKVMTMLRWIRNSGLCLTLALLLTGCAGPRMGQSFRDLRYPVATQLLDVEGVQVAYSDSGGAQDAPALLLIHGLGSYLPAWSQNLAALAQHHRVVAIDLPGFGRSSKGNYNYSMEFFARVVDGVIERLKLARVVMVGHSMGGQIALTHALLFPGKAQALALCAPAGLEVFDGPEGTWLAEATGKDTIKATPPEGIYVNLAGNFYDMPKAARFMAEDRVKIIGGPDFDGYAYAVSRSVAAMLDGPVVERLPQIQLPVLGVYGKDDGLIPNPFLHGGSTRAVAEKGVARLPRGRLVLVPRAGHFVMFEQAARVNQEILGFVAALPVAAQPVSAPAVSAPAVSAPPAGATP